jgi:hypothetical protein
VKVGDLVKGVDELSEFTYGIVLKTDVNLWGEETVPSGISILWCEGETEIVTQDEVEVINDEESR